MSLIFFIMHAGSAATGSSEPSTEPVAVDPAQRQPTPDRESELVLETADFAEVEKGRLDSVVT